MQQIVLTHRAAAVPNQVRLPVQKMAKIALWVLPAAAILIGSGLLVQNRFGHASSLHGAAAQTGPATVKMMQVIRYDHDAVRDYVKAQTAAEKARNAAEDMADAQAAADAKLAAADAVSHPAPVAVAAAAPIVWHAKARASAIAPTPLPPQAPLAITQAQQPDGAPPPVAAPAAPDSLLAKTVHATLHVVSAIGGIPNWIAGMGGRIGGAGADATGDARLVSSSS